MNATESNTGPVADADSNVPPGMRDLPYPLPPAVVVRLPKKQLQAMWRLAWLTGLGINDALSLLLGEVVGDAMKPGKHANDVPANYENVIKTFVGIRRSLLALHQRRLRILEAPAAAAPMANPPPPKMPRELQLPDRIVVSLSASLNQKLYRWGEETGLTRSRIASTVLTHVDIETILKVVLQADSGSQTSQRNGRQNLRHRQSRGNHDR